MHENTPRPRIITIDGPPGAGKTTQTRLIAKIDGRDAISSGPYFCAIGYAIKNGLVAQGAVTDPHFDVTEKIHIEHSSDTVQASFDGVEVEGSIFDEENRSIAATISHLPHINEQVELMMREQTATGYWVVDRGPNIFPDADRKIRLSAHVGIRAARRYAEIAGTPNNSYIKTLHAMKEREQRDAENNFLSMPNDAIVINTSYLTPEEVALKILRPDYS